MTNRNHKDYWKRNIRLVGILLAIWFTVSLVFGSLAVDLLDKIAIPGTGFTLGFWFGQQGSIIIFVILIAVYVRRMNKLDEEFGFHDEPQQTKQPSE